MIDHFGILAPIYDRVVRPKEPDKIISLAALPVSGALLDAGGGTGRVAQTLGGYASSLIVADLSHDMLQKASNKNYLEAVCSHSESLPFPDEYFERVIMVDALHHVCDYIKTTGELWRVLKKGGRIVIEEPDIRNFSVKLVALAEKLAFMRSYFISPPKIAGLFDYSNAHTHIESEGFNAWVVVEKIGDSD